MSESLKIAHKGDPKPDKTGNIVLDIKSHLNHCYDLKRNLISRNIEIDGNPIDDIILNTIFISCKTDISKTTKDLISSIIFSEFIIPFNPFFDFFNKYKGQTASGNIDRLVGSIKTDTANYDFFIKKWLVSIIASIHGKHSPLLLVLTGPQNTGKTEWFRRLLPDSLQKYYAESKLDLGKDDEILMTKKLIIMDDEMGGKSKTEQKKLKEMTSKQIFSIREPYGRISLDLKRLAVLCGTANDEELLNDPTGNRRILPVRVLSVIFDIYNSIDKDLLFYEMYLLYKSGYDYNLTSGDIDILNKSTTEFKQSSSEEELVSKYYSNPKIIGGYAIDRTNSEILSYIQTNSQLKLSQTKLGLVLKQMGFEQVHKKYNGTTIRVYRVIENNLSNAKQIEDAEIKKNEEENAPF